MVTAIDVDFVENFILCVKVESWWISISGEQRRASELAIENSMR